MAKTIIDDNGNEWVVVPPGTTVESTSSLYYVSEDGTTLVHDSIMDCAELLVWNDEDEEWKPVRWLYTNNDGAVLVYT
jgi:hypothetical protein